MLTACVRHGFTVGEIPVNVHYDESASTTNLGSTLAMIRDLWRVRKAWPTGFLIDPGIRPAETAAIDQKRIMTPRAALDAGASILVVGRAVTAAADPVAALRAIEATL